MITLEDQYFQDNATYRNTSQQYKPDVRTDLGQLPLYRENDVYVDSASAVNGGADYAVSFLTQPESYCNKVDEDSFRHAYITVATRGNRVPPGMDYTVNMKTKEQEPAHWVLNNEHYLNEQASARHGFHGINRPSRISVANQTSITEGANNNMREHGFERNTNPTVYPTLPTGNPLSVEPNLATLDVERINSVPVDPIPVFPTANF